MHDAMCLTGPQWCQRKSVFRMSRHLCCDLSQTSMCGTYVKYVGEQVYHHTEICECFVMKSLSTTTWSGHPMKSYVNDNAAHFVNEVDGKMLCLNLALFEHTLKDNSKRTRFPCLVRTAWPFTTARKSISTLTLRRMTSTRMI